MTETAGPIGCLMLALAVLAGCSSTFPAPSTPEPTHQATAKPSPTEAAPASFSSAPLASPTGPCARGGLSVDRAPYVIAGIQVPGFFPQMAPSGWQADDLALRDVVVIGTVTSKEAGFTAGISVYTPLTLDVETVVHGDGHLGSTRVVVEGGTAGGGTAGCLTIDVDVSPRLEVGRRYVFFLYDGGPGVGPGEVFDAWRIDAGDIVLTVQGPMPLSDLVDRIERIAAAGGPANPSAASSTRP